MSIVTFSHPRISIYSNWASYNPYVRCVFDNLEVVRSLLLEAGVLGRWGFLFLNQFGCVSPEIGKEHLEASFCLRSPSSPADPLFMRQCNVAEKCKPLGSKIYLSPLLPVPFLVDSLLPSRKPLVHPFCVAFFGDPPLQCLPGEIGAPEVEFLSRLAQKLAIFSLDKYSLAKIDCYWLLRLSILLWLAWRHQRKTVISIQDYPRSSEKTYNIPIDSKGERRMEWRMEEDRLEHGLAGQEWLIVAYEIGTPFFTLNNDLHRLNDTSRKQTIGTTRAGVNAREGMRAEATGIDSDVRKREPNPPLAPTITNKLPPSLDHVITEFKVEENAIIPVYAYLGTIPVDDLVDLGPEPVN
ncbi:unnamed protein product [Vicia faba]|uniref:Uncharacterized protein n=1 Tax=Vicia faba TaxID=3906 RepID=A0AAV0ZZE2_VICFA|nr:unnamed protein product [Vicia faba]